MARVDPGYFKQNRLQQLRGFCYAALSGSISRAAERMALTQPSVSLQIQALEKELGVTLFERHGPRIRLTPDGQALFEIAQPLVERIEALPETFADVRGTLDRGELDIAAGESTLLYLLPRFIKRFATEYPGVRFRLHNVTGRDGLAMLRTDQADLAAGSMLDIPEDIEYRPLYTYDTVLITAPDHPLAKTPHVTLRDISRYGLILPPRHLSTWRVVRYVFGQHHLVPRVDLQAGGWEVIKKYVGLGLGISIVTAICLTADDNLHVRSLSQYFPERTYGVVSRRGKFLSPQARRFIEVMESGAAEAKAVAPARPAASPSASRRARAARVAVGVADTANGSPGILRR